MFFPVRPHLCVLGAFVSLSFQIKCHLYYEDFSEHVAKRKSPVILSAAALSPQFLAQLTVMSFVRLRAFTGLWHVSQVPEDGVPNSLVRHTIPAPSA